MFLYLSLYLIKRRNKTLNYFDVIKIILIENANVFRFVCVCFQYNMPCLVYMMRIYGEVHAVHGNMVEYKHNLRNKMAGPKL